MYFKKWDLEAQDKDRWWVVVNAVMNIIILYKMKGIS